MREPVQSQARVRDRFGAVLTASMSMLSVEAVLGGIALFVWGQTKESPGLPPSAPGVILLILVAPVMAVIGAVVAALLSIGVVMPLVSVAGWFGRRFSGREAWWWLPVLAAVSTSPLALAAVMLNGAEALACLGVWLVAAAALAATALVARRLLLAGRPHLSGGVMFRRVALYGTLAAVTSGTLAAISLYAGLGYEPPRLGAEGVVGTWSDGRGGTLTLTAEGQATAIRVKTFDLDDSFETVVHTCTGTGTWKYDPGTGPWSQEVAVSVDDCPLDTWEVFGSSEHPKLFVYIGDPDSWDLYVLERAGDPWRQQRP
ncbi:hypothetical protein AB0D84_18355 [Streptomyces sp. NPDC048193]|uniref:hypothetical protein n=1 Tax=unclassified Streptomyces TaxID=2593676 RepID=UPI0034120240